MTGDTRQLAVALLDAANAAHGKEPIAQVADGAFDPSLVFGPGHRAEARLDAHSPA